MTAAVTEIAAAVAAAAAHAVPIAAAAAADLVAAVVAVAAVAAIVTKQRPGPIAELVATRATDQSQSNCGMKFPRLNFCALMPASAARCCVAYSL